MITYTDPFTLFVIRTMLSVAHEAPSGLVKS